MSFTTILRGLAAALAGLLVLSACVVVEEPGPGPAPWPGPRPEPGACTREYNPVCARRGDERRTFANACVAERAGYRSIRPGECRRGGGGGGEEPRFCTREYRPVCARRNGDFRTFGNSCEADAAGWRIVGNGEC
jgi:hypothetical protein